MTARPEPGTCTCRHVLGTSWCPQRGPDPVAAIFELCSARRSCMAATSAHAHRGAPLRRAAVALAAFLGCLVAFFGLGAEAAFAQGEAIQGILKNEGNPVQGVRVDVATVDGKPVGSATSDPTGKWVVKVPKGGQYKVTLADD